MLFNVVSPQKMAIILNLHGLKARERNPIFKRYQNDWATEELANNKSRTNDDMATPKAGSKFPRNTLTSKRMPANGQEEYRGISMPLRTRGRRVVNDESDEDDDEGEKKEEEDDMDT